MGVVIGIDVGGTKVQVGVADAHGQVLSRERVETRARDGAEQVFAQVVQAVTAAAAGAGVQPEQALAIGIGTPGQLDLEQGLVVDSPNLPWRHYPLREQLSQRFGGVPVALENDCKAGGLGEFRFGAGRGSRHMVYLGVGTGIGGAIFVDGRLLYGATGNAAELGHTVVDLDGPPCGCGGRGCVEALASGSGLTNLGRAAAAAGQAPLLLELAGGDLQRIDGGTVVAAARAGDAGAVAILDRATRALGAAVATVVNTLSPEVVVLGGGVVERNGAGYVTAVTEQARRLALAANWRAVQVRQAALGAESVLVGAIALALEQAARAGQ